MRAAAATKGGVDGVPQSVGKEFDKADPGGKLPKRKGDAMYDHRTSPKPK